MEHHGRQQTFHPLMTEPPDQTLHDFVELSNGELYRFDQPTHVTIDVLAHSLSMVCRFAFQCSTFYSVAQHSVLVSYIMEKDGGDPLEGLLHDSDEFIMGDQPTPIKYRMPEFRRRARMIDESIREYYGLPRGKTPECNSADKIAMFLEAYHLMPSRGSTFDDILGLRSAALDRLKEFDGLLFPWDPWLAKQKFLQRYYEVKHP